MKLKNRFKNEDKIRYWIDHPYCHKPGEITICGSNQGCSLHHIDGTSSGSIFNSIMLCDRHHRIADGHNTDSPSSEAYREELRSYTYARIMGIGKKLTQIDKDYLEKHNLTII